VIDMTNNDRVRLIFHGALVLLVGLLCGLPTVTEEGGESLRHWHTAHEALILMGIWILAMASVIPSLVLESREARALRWSLVALGYGFMTALLIQGVTGARAFEPGGSPVRIVEFTATVVGILGAVMATLLTMKGARAALTGVRPE
jgi:hypothetical protein